MKADVYLPMPCTPLRPHYAHRFYIQSAVITNVVECPGNMPENEPSNG